MRIILDGFNPDEKDVNDPVFFAHDDASSMTISRTANKMFVDVKVTDKNGNEASVIIKVIDLQRACIPL